jgi:hypothetical protein
VQLDDINFYSDSRLVLGYINNETKLSYTNDAYRVTRTCSFSLLSQWLFLWSEFIQTDAGTFKMNVMHLATWMRCSSEKEPVQVVDETYILMNPEVDKDSE